MPGNRSDYGTEQTDRAVKRVERRLSSVYREAQRDIDDKLKDWQERHKKRDARYRQMVADGKMSKEDYRAWVRGQVFQEKQWQARRAEIDNILLNADRAAQNIVNDGKLGVFTANANYMGYALERDSNIDTGFVLYSEGTVARLIEDDPQILPKPAPGVQKDLAFPYYNKLMSSAITQGIVQGETISEIAGRVARTTGESSYKSAMRNARTAYTGAQNAGRIEGLHQAQRLGIKVKKKWLAILDSRTRDAHANLDGQIQEVDDPFKSDLGEIMFPGDPTAKPGNVMNCRCTLTYEYPDYPSTMPRRDAENGQIVADMTYREWEDWKRGGSAATSKAIPFTDRIAALKHSGEYTVDEFKSAGEIVNEEYQNRLIAEKGEIISEYERYSQQVDELDKWYRGETKRILSETRDNRKERQERLDEFKASEKFLKLTDARVKAGKLNRELNEASRNVLLKTLRDIKKFGGFTKKELMDGLLTNSRSSPAVDNIVDAVSMYPKSWTQHRIDAGKILVKRQSTGRAHFDNILNELTTDGSLQTTVHEYGHALEYGVPGLQKAANDFYKYRTKDCSLEKLSDIMGSGYNPNEVTRRDNFRSPYMGKDYGSDKPSFATELLSMGYEELFGSTTSYDRQYYDKDSEMRNWLLGLLAMVD